MLKAFVNREPKLCAKTLDRITNQDFIDVRNRWLNELKLKPGAVKRELNPIRHMFRIARKEWHLDIDPFRDLTLPDDPPIRKRPLKPEEDLLLYKAIEEQCRDDKLRVRWLCLVSLAFSTALRRGIFLKLKWEDIDWDEKIINIPNSYWGPGKVAPPAVPLTMRTDSLLELYSSYLIDDEKAPKERLFPITSSGFESAWDRIVKHSGLPDLHFHDLRHTAVTRYATLKPRALDIRENNYLLGKNLVSYEHAEPELLDSIRGKLDAADDYFAHQSIGSSFMSPAEIATGRAYVRSRGDGDNLEPMPSPQEWLQQKEAERQRQQRATIDEGAPPLKPRMKKSVHTLR
jgi:integrase